MNDWFKKHVDTVIILTGILGSVMWMNGKFSQIEKEIAIIDKEVAIIKTVLICNKIIPPQLAHIEEKNKDVL